MTSLSSDQVHKFQHFIHRFFKNHGRHDLPWRQTYDPYHVLVSEIMLQQTQVERVIPKFKHFLEVFPDIQKLAQASTAVVIGEWQGLGYNRRGLNLQKAAQKVVADFEGKVPSDLDDLISLPGIGPYTAAAVQAFAFNKPSTVVETNIRTIFLHHFFPGVEKVSDEELKPLITHTMDLVAPRQWYSALMDYGTYLKSVLPNPSRRSKHYAKQSKFEGSNRQVRGAILKTLSTNSQLSTQDLYQALDMESHRVDQALTQLVKEGFVAYEADSLKLAS